MQTVLNNIAVTNPCREIGNVPTQVNRAQLRPYNRAEEESKMGTFQLETGVNGLLVALGNDVEYNLDELEEFNMNVD